MSVYAIADLHLSFCPWVDKPMDIYGAGWYDHAARLKENWCSTINEKDTVVIPGDISWGLKLPEAKYDLDWIDALPGHKVLIKGNHDLWWNGITKLNKMYEGITFLQNDCYYTEGLCICGSRGWLTPDNDDFGDDDEKIYRRELMRLKSSLDKAKSAAEDGGAEIIVAMHYPPVSKLNSFSGFQQLFEDYGIKRVIYGHIHGDDGVRKAISGVHHGVDYRLVSLDRLHCRPLCIHSGGHDNEYR